MESTWTDGILETSGEKAFYRLLETNGFISPNMTFVWEGESGYYLRVLLPIDVCPVPT